MRYVIHHIETGYVLFVQEVHSVRILFAKNGNQNIGTRYFFLARTLHVENCTLKNSLKSQRRLSFTVIAFIKQRSVFVRSGLTAGVQRS